MRKLQDILDDVPFESLPPAWTTFDLRTFSTSKQLWDYQTSALENALKALCEYYRLGCDFQAGEPSSVTDERKQALARWYRDNGLEVAHDVALGGKRDVRRLLSEYYPTVDDRVPFVHFLNSIAFWMATGSGKTLVLVKLIELLWRLIRMGELPPHDILVLTCREDLLAQLRAHVDDFNAARGDLYIQLHNLRDYPEVKRAAASLFGHQEAHVFFYRSDNLSDMQKERIVNFRNYDQSGQWYVLLDEAHKGDRGDSKRKIIYNILSRNGFLFNFSATFTDPHDIATCAFDFNLARFIERGYGKHIAVLLQENRAFRNDEDYTGEEKQKAVLKALLLLAYAQKSGERLVGAGKGAAVYHRPLLLTLVNSVNKQDADLKLFFRELERIGKAEVPDVVFDQAKAELRQELAQRPQLIFETHRYVADPSLMPATQADLRRLVYHSAAPGDVEVWVRPSNRQEIALKIKPADRPFALIKIGDISGWLKDELSGYQLVEGFQDESFFERLNRDDSAVNILMGSRSFYEGWDSNRPNVVLFINIGTATDARKFILQSIGRGVRIEPLTGQRKRLAELHNARTVTDDLYQRLKDHVQALETLFIFGTNRRALHTVITELDQEKGKEGEHELALEVNQAVVDDHILLIPTYRAAEGHILDQRDVRKFELAADELSQLSAYVDYLGDDRLLMAHHGAAPTQIRLLNQCLADPHRYFNSANGRRYGRLDVLLPRLFAYFQLVPQELNGLKPLEDEIRHFRHIKVFLRDITQLQQDIERVKQYPQRATLLADLERRFEAKQMSFPDMLRETERIHQLVRETQAEYRATTLQVRYIAHHYYVPVILSYDEKVDFIQHIIRHPSEVRFLNALDTYVQQENHAFTEFDWWLFSRIDETMDEVNLPYYDPEANRIRQFRPDFIFWMQKGTDYRIVFVDPKGMQHAGYQHKIDGYRTLFLDGTGGMRTFPHGGLQVRVGLLLHTEDPNKAPREYRRYWFDSPSTIATCMPS